MRVLLDTNILFSALITDGRERYLIEKIIASYHTIVITDFIAEEIEAVLLKKLSPRGSLKTRTILRNIQKEKFFYTKKRVQYQKFISRAKQLINEKDAPILAAGLQPEINAIITGDKDFLQNKKLTFLRRKKVFNTKEILNLL